MVDDLVRVRVTARARARVRAPVGLGLGLGLGSGLSGLGEYGLGLGVGVGFDGVRVLDTHGDEYAAERLGEYHGPRGAAEAVQQPLLPR